MREKEGPTISAVATGKVRVWASPENSVWVRFRLSPYQVSRSPPVIESDSQGKVRMGSVICGKRSARPYWPL